MDYLRSDDIYENYIRYQGQLIEQFNTMSKEYHFHVVDANQGVPEVFDESAMNMMRDDAAIETTNPEEFLAQAPGKQDGYIKVKSILE